MLTAEVLMREALKIREGEYLMSAKQFALLKNSGRSISVLAHGHSNPASLKATSHQSVRTAA